MKLEHLLDQRSFDSDSYLVSVQWTDANNLVLSIEGTPWWEEPKVNSRGRIDISLAGVLDSSFQLISRSDSLETLGVERNTSLLEDFGSRGKIFCSTPLTDPHGFVVDFLSIANEYRDPIRYLCGDGTIESWMKNTKTTAYALFEGPERLLRLLKSKLETLNVHHQAFVAESSSRSDLIQVSIGNSWIICEDATVEVK